MPVSDQKQTEVSCRETEKGSLQGSVPHEQEKARNGSQDEQKVPGLDSIPPESINQLINEKMTHCASAMYQALLDIDTLGATLFYS